MELQQATSDEIVIPSLISLVAARVPSSKYGKAADDLYDTMRSAASSPSAIADLDIDDATVQSMLTLLRNMNNRRPITATVKVSRRAATVAPDFI